MDVRKQIQKIIFESESKNWIDFTKQTEFHSKNKLWFGAPFPMSSFRKFLDYTKGKVSNFVELGIGDGEKSLAASKVFSQVYSIEIYEPYIQHFQEIIKEEHIGNITILPGDILTETTKTPQVPSAVFTFVPFGDNIKNMQMIKICVNHFPSGSIFLFAGLDRHTANEPELKNLLEPYNIEGYTMIFWIKK
jgi:hypothetical protein